MFKQFVARKQLASLARCLTENNINIDKFCHIMKKNLLEGQGDLEYDMSELILESFQEAIWPFGKKTNPAEQEFYSKYRSGNRYAQRQEQRPDYYNPSGQNSYSQKYFNWRGDFTGKKPFDQNNPYDVALQKLHDLMVALKPIGLNVRDIQKLEDKIEAKKYAFGQGQKNPMAGFQPQPVPHPQFDVSQQDEPQEVTPPAQPAANQTPSGDRAAQVQRFFNALPNWRDQISVYSTANGKPQNLKNGDVILNALRKRDQRWNSYFVKFGPRHEWVPFQDLQRMYAAYMDDSTGGHDMETSLPMTRDT